MNIEGVVIAALVVGIAGLVIGLFLGVAAEKFKVEVDEKEAAIRELLPGNNCGGCGYAGCDALAKAISLGEAKADACPVGGTKAAEGIGAIMGAKVSKMEKKVAFVKCSGTCDKTEMKYHYFGVSDCTQVAIIPGKGPKKCSYGCMGYGSCVKVCVFDAIHIKNGIAVVDKEKCRACGTCVAKCPNQIIELVPYESNYQVACSSLDKGKEVKMACSIGCIGCMMCTKVCEHDAITVNNNLAQIDYSKCTNCGKCADKCPVKVIKPSIC